MSRKKVIRKFGILLIAINLAIVCQSPMKAMENDSNDTDKRNEFTEQGLPASHEPPMPQIAIDISELSNEEVEACIAEITAERSLWANLVIQESEEFYGQTIKSVYETDDYYVFEFYPKNYGAEPKNIPDSSGIISVQYLKLESVTGREIKNYNTRYENYDTKIITYYGWSNGYVNYKSKTKQFIDFAGIVIGFVPTSSRYASTLQLLAFGGTLYNSIADSVPVTTQTLYQSYYQNKVGSVYISGLWQNTAYVGSRRCFGWSWSCYTMASGMASDPYFTSQTTPNSESNPTNYDGNIEKKSHFDDNTWIMNKALAQWNLHYLYMDVYEMVYLH